MKNNGNVDSCRRCSGQARKLKDGLCPTCYDQADMSEWEQNSNSRSQPDGFWNKLFNFLTLFGITKGDDDKGGKDGEG